ncbi:PEP-CTERM sorting domain-containing protein [Hydrocoleum sp. CS-953]|uniref:PEP-CTERM sorting domain-containing protein n=1 Tax=Hydrocoleum sp. CS-953 TaxID=1671698 RepID=UPI000B9BCDFB|nr:PEP-CTERM sorting domain-containing protein [Hydrocoleum sp. CS-953]
MTNILQKLSFVATSAVLGITVINANPVNAASIIYDFEVNNLDGSLAGETYSGYFEFDGSALTGSGEELLSVSELSFDFLGVNYTENDGIFSDVVFLDGEFLGLDFSTDAVFSFIPGLFDLGDAFFEYDTLGEGVGTGDIIYTLRQEPPASTPEPTAVFSLLALGAVGGSGVLKKRK